MINNFFLAYSLSVKASRRASSSPMHIYTHQRIWKSKKGNCSRACDLFPFSGTFVFVFSLSRTEKWRNYKGYCNFTTNMNLRKKNCYIIVKFRLTTTEVNYIVEFYLHASISLLILQKSTCVLRQICLFMYFQILYIFLIPLTQEDYKYKLWFMISCWQLWQRAYLTLIW